MAIEFQFDSFANSSNMLLVGKIATVASIGIFAGTALSYSAIIMPSLRKFSSASSVAIWSETFHASKFLQLSMIAVGVAGSAGLYYQTKNASYLYSAITLATVVPYTLVALLPVSKKLFAIRQNNTVNGKSNSMKDNKSDDSQVEELLNRWSLIYAGRTFLGYAALLTALYGVASDNGIRFILFK
ncbi:hypothetical protein EDD11_002182 [Mortierella claussenii]|nr:hypothetical protein EDD11_002182 [Mortierella claussenii]